MKRLTITLLLLTGITAIALAWLNLTPSGKRIRALHLPKTESVITRSTVPSLKLKTRASDAKSFVKEKNYNADFCFLIDLSLPSCQNRFFIYDLKKDSILDSGLVTHGNCNEYWLEGRKYGNTVGCGCSSLGKYKVGYSYYGKFGLAFKLYGLDKTNDNAFKRYVVLHSHSCVPETEIDSDICQSNGCPTVSPGFLKVLDPMIKGSGKPVLLWIME